MYTVLLVDDEEEVIQVIMRKINWDELGFSVIGSAGNGVRALELVEEFQPDVLVTDIKMPYMDGMELSNRVKAEFPSTKILLFTGFDEFEYAKEAIHLEVEEYILKPVNSSELISVFSHLKIKLDQEISEKRNVETLKYVVCTHPDEDHIGGMDVILYKFDCQTIFMTDEEKDTNTYRDVVDTMTARGYQWTLPEVGQQYFLGDAVFTILGPSELGSDSNNNSVSLLLVHGDNRFLFTGDAEPEEEE